MLISLVVKESMCSVEYVYPSTWRFLSNFFKVSGGDGGGEMFKTLFARGLIFILLNVKCGSKFSKFNPIIDRSEYKLSGGEGF